MERPVLPLLPDNAVVLRLSLDPVVRRLTTDLLRPTPESFVVFLWDADRSLVVFLETGGDDDARLENERMGLKSLRFACMQGKVKNFVLGTPLGGL